MSKNDIIRLSTLFILIPLACQDPHQHPRLPSGVYEVVDHSLNAIGCEDTGDPVEASARVAFIVIFDDTVLGEAVSRVFSCEDPQDCQALRDAVLTSVSGPVPLISLTFRDVYQDGRGTVVDQSSGFATGTGLCERPQRVISTVQITADGELNLQTRTRTGDGYDSTEDGFCTVDEGRNATEAADCSSLTTIRAVRTR